MHTTTHTAPAAPNTRRTAADVKADRRSPAGPGLDTDEDRRTLTQAGTTPAADSDHRHNASMRTIKRQLLQAQDSTFAEAAHEADRLMLDAFDSPDFREGLESYLGGRPPAFPGLAAAP